MHYDAFFKQLFQTLFTNQQIRVETSLRVGELPLEIDMVFYRSTTTNLAAVWGPFVTLTRDYDVVEFKSESNKFYRKTVHKR